MAPRQRDFGVALQDHLFALASPEHRNPHLIGQASRALNQTPGELAPHELVRFRTNCEIITEIALSPRGDMAFVGKSSLDPKVQEFNLWTGSIHKPNDLEEQIHAADRIIGLKYPKNSYLPNDVACLYEKNHVLHVFWQRGVWNAQICEKASYQEILQVVFWSPGPSDFYVSIVMRSKNGSIKCHTYTRNGSDSARCIREHYIPGYQPRIVDTSTDEECLLYRSFNMHAPGYTQSQPGFYWYKGLRTPVLYYSDNPVLLDPEECNVVCADGYDQKKRRHCILRNGQIYHLGPVILGDGDQDYGATCLYKDKLLLIAPIAYPQREEGSLDIRGGKWRLISSKNNDSFDMNGFGPGAHEMMIMDDKTLVVVDKGVDDCLEHATLMIMDSDFCVVSTLRIDNPEPCSTTVKPTWRNDGDRLLIVGDHGILWLTADQLKQNFVIGLPGLRGYGSTADQIVRHEKGYLISAGHVGAGHISIRRYLAREFDQLLENHE